MYASIILFDAFLSIGLQLELEEKRKGKEKTDVEYDVTCFCD